VSFKPHFNGPEYEESRDFHRLSKQHERIRDLMLGDGRWRTVAEIAKATGDPENSTQAQLRHLRKKRFGGYIVEKKREGALYKYRVRPRTEADGPAPSEKTPRKNKVATELEKLCEEIASWLDKVHPTAAKRVRSRVTEITGRDGL
jgi:choline dehydrogenase-like flavoprotein